MAGNIIDWQPDPAHDGVWCYLKGRVILWWWQKSSGTTTPSSPVQRQTSPKHNLLRGRKMKEEEEENDVNQSPDFKAHPRLWKGHCRHPRNLGICSIYQLFSPVPASMVSGLIRCFSCLTILENWTCLAEGRNKQSWEKRNVWLKMPIKSIQPCSSGSHRNDSSFIIYSSRAAVLSFQWPLIDYELSTVHTDRNGGTGVPVWRSVWSLKVSGLIHRDFKAIKGYLGKQIEGK